MEFEIEAQAWKESAKQDPPFFGYSTEAITKKIEWLRQVVPCLPKMKGLLVRVGDRLEELNVGTLTISRGRDHVRTPREEVMEEMRKRVDQFAKDSEELLKMLVG